MRVTPQDLDKKRLILALSRNEFWLTLENYWREEYLPELYKLACGRPDMIGRKWHSGRAALMQELLDQMETLRNGDGR